MQEYILATQTQPDSACQGTSKQTKWSVRKEKIETLLEELVASDGDIDPILADSQRLKTPSAPTDLAIASPKPDKDAAWTAYQHSKFKVDDSFLVCYVWVDTGDDGFQAGQTAWLCPLKHYSLGMLVEASILSMDLDTGFGMVEIKVPFEFCDTMSDNCFKGFG